MDRELTELVWHRARSTCEYCQMPQAFDALTFEIDHVIASTHGGKTVANNLALSCAIGTRVQTSRGLIRSLAKKRDCFIHDVTPGIGASRGTDRVS